MNIPKFSHLCIFPLLIHAKSVYPSTSYTVITLQSYFPFDVWKIMVLASISFCSFDYLREDSNQSALYLRRILPLGIHILPLSFVRLVCFCRVIYGGVCYFWFIICETSDAMCGSHLYVLGFIVCIHPVVVWSRYFHFIVLSSHPHQTHPICPNRSGNSSRLDPLFYTFYTLMRGHGSYFWEKRNTKASCFVLWQSEWRGWWKKYVGYLRFTITSPPVLPLFSLSFVFSSFFS